jgi:hypothetical protein
VVADQGVQGAVGQRGAQGVPVALLFPDELDRSDAEDDEDFAEDFADELIDDRAEEEDEDFADELATLDADTLDAPPGQHAVAYSGTPR